MTEATQAQIQALEHGQIRLEKQIDALAVKLEDSFREAIRDLKTDQIAEIKKTIDSYDQSCHACRREVYSALRGSEDRIAGAIRAIEVAHNKRIAALEVTSGEQKGAQKGAFGVLQAIWMIVAAAVGWLINWASHNALPPVH